MLKKNDIIIRGARLHNLKNISINIPKNQIVVITGVSGSGKSTLAYDTIYAEAQRRYIESLSSYARQFLKNHNKPEVEYITGLSPAIAIEQKSHINNPRSTVGTITEIYYYLTLLYEKNGKTFSPISGKKVTKYSFQDFKKYISTFRTKCKFIICCPVKMHQLKYLKEKGYTRLLINSKITKIDDIKDSYDTSELILDRLIYEANSDFEAILKKTYQEAIEIGMGQFSIYNENRKLLKKINTNFFLDNMYFQEPNKDLFNFNNPYGACEYCNGHGDLIEIDPEKVIPNKELSVLENMIHPWKNGKMEKWKNDLIKKSAAIQFPLNIKYSNLSQEEKKILWHGKSNFSGIYGFFDFLKRKSYKIQYRVMLSKYKSRSICKKCKGNRLKTISEYIKINNQNIQALINYPIKDLLTFIKKIKVSKKEKKVTEKIKHEVISRLNILIELGLGYLTLNRKSNSLSGGEIQKINIAKSIGSGLIGSLYILDEPSIGLHSRDTNKLINILNQLKHLGNSIIIVEHDKDIIKAADHIIEMGPFAGMNGGNIIYSGDTNNKEKKSRTLNYMRVKKNEKLKYRKIKEFIQVTNITKNNLKNINVDIPINVLTAITGVSGSGKTTLLRDILLPAIKRKLRDYSFPKPKCESIDFNINKIENIDFLNQESIKKSSKSTPITYINGFDSIRNIFASQKLAKLNQFKKQHFSFNIKGGRCEECKGQGFVNVEMQFLSDIKLICNSCKGKRYENSILKVYVEDKNIADILDLTIKEASDFFRKYDYKIIADQIEPLIEVGLSYLKLGQPVSTLSSGEAQRLKIASFLSKKKSKSVLIFDEPTKGLHFYDIEILIKAFQKLVNLGNTIIIIEHNLELIKNVDWVIDLGPEAGDNGGKIIFQGNPMNLMGMKTHTGKAFTNELKN